MKKVVLVTGSATGFGREIALTFARHGWITYATVKELDDNSSQLEEISKSEALSLKILKLDVTIAQDIEKVVSTIIQDEGRIDLLVNNAGFGFVGPVEEFTMEEIQEQYEVNLFGAIRMIKAVVPHMRIAGGGQIINISSVNGLVSFPLYGIYSSSKFALETISEVLRFELAPFKIKVSIVEPGGFNTKFSINRRIAKRTMSEDSAYRHWAPGFLDDIGNTRLKEKGLVGRLLDPKHVSNLVWKIVNKRNPRLRYLVGLDTWFFVIARRVLPYRVWKFCINRGYGWK